MKKLFTPLKLFIVEQFAGQACLFANTFVTEICLRNLMTTNKTHLHNRHVGTLNDGQMTLQHSSVGWFIGLLLGFPHLNLNKLCTSQYPFSSFF